MKYLAIIIAVLFVIPVYGQRKKKDDETTATTPVYVEGVVYTLPRTVIRVNVSAVKEIFQPGPYCDYAEQMLGITDVRKKAETKWIIDDINIETYSEPDPDQVHKALGDAASLLSLSENGCLTGINTSAANDEVSKMINTNRVGQRNTFDQGNEFSYFTDTPFYTPGDSTNNFRPMRVSTETKMAEAAKRVLDSRRFQYDIAAGMMDEFHPDGEAYKVSLKELKKMEEDYLSLFIGKSDYQKGTFSFDYVPGKTPGKAEVIFRISEENGIVPPSDLSGKPVMIEFETDKNLAQKFADGAKSDNPNAGESGIYYRMPGQATIKIINDLNVVATARTTIAQFGEIAPVPEDFLYGDYSLQFYPETGAIKSIVKKRSASVVQE